MELLFLIKWINDIKVGWLLLDSWQNSTPPIHHIFIQFFVPFVLHNLRFWCYFCKSFEVQWLRPLALDWLMVGSNPSLAIFFSFFFPKRNKKLNKNVMNWRGRILPTVQHKSTNFSNLIDYHFVCKNNTMYVVLWLESA